MQYFEHEKLDVYQVAIQLIILIEDMVKQFPKGRAYLVDQLQRVSSSVSLNIGEGAGEFSVNEKIRFYRIARRSATECASIIDICMRLKLTEEITGMKLRCLLLRIVSMLTKMTRHSSGTETQTVTWRSAQARRQLILRG